MNTKKMALSIVVASMMLITTACGNLNGGSGVSPQPTKPTKDKHMTSTTNQSDPTNAVKADNSAIVDLDVKADAKAEAGKAQMGAHINTGLQVKIDGKQLTDDLKRALTVKVRKGLTLSEALKETNVVEMDSKNKIKAVEGVKGNWKLKVNGQAIHKANLDLKVKNGDKVELLLSK
ncbi:DUF4430 domain-containing protein [Thermoflavimicrobium daqui]|uniref:Transcobalamin-like C-terminal domain-containing protein n=1 Tax=Thermoflavimicrobium daqui TaxID=2137476 RepID=A0A364K1R2_9BACL|nr:DUF4430 domain-containing protein [Thermoflavimicrobium daqui]RAL21895.1 hypothetical protein DL897_15880 [Thermoflavimicrobium daqui]